MWEGEGYWRSEIMNASNNDYWVGFLRKSPGQEYDQDLRVLSGSYEGLKSPKKG